ncbi:MAG: DUF3180 family protein [Solirubrobacterales bacterium]
MSRDVPPVGEAPKPPPPSEGRVRPTGPGPLVVVGLVGLVIGWAIRGQAIRADAPDPGVSWLAVATAFFVAAVVGAIAYLTWRTVHRDHLRLTAQQGVARLVLGKAVARLGALGLGAYIGIAVSHLGVDSEHTAVTITRAFLAALGAATALTAGLLLEHACRIPPEDQ